MNRKTLLQHIRLLLLDLPEDEQELSRLFQMILKHIPDTELHEFFEDHPGMRYVLDNWDERR